MKKFFVIITLMVATLAIGTAQERRNFGTPEERAKNQTERLHQLLQLTDEQKTKINAVNLELAKKLEADLQNNREDREAMRTKMQEAETAREKKYKEILTDEQLKKYLEDRAAREKQMQERRGQRGNGEGNGQRRRNSTPQ
ncbi:MAG: hypothetical protein LBR08_06270 [Bacteroidales bacterium]|jgi:Spy/CpxP family protein refolding chaperone|nr:hypothetical protein [Bacteroidales bacterium]